MNEDTMPLEEQILQDEQTDANNSASLTELELELLAIYHNTDVQEIQQFADKTTPADWEGKFDSLGHYIMAQFSGTVEEDAQDEEEMVKSLFPSLSGEQY
jgi:hypothetical protein